MNNCYLKEFDCIGLPRFYKLYHKMFDKSNVADKCMAWALMREYGTFSKMKAIYDNSFEMRIPINPKVDAYMEANAFGPKNEADLMMICTNEGGKGYGMELMRHLQRVFTCIRTSWDASTVQGRELCLKAGFKHEGDILIWKKETT